MKSPFITKKSPKILNGLFASPQAKSIYDNLNFNEKADLYQIIHTNSGSSTKPALVGLFAGGWVWLTARALRPLPPHLFFPLWVTLAFFPSIFYAGITFPRKSRKVKEFLIQTEYAKQMGYTPETLRLFSWPHPASPSKAG